MRCSLLQLAGLVGCCCVLLACSPLLVPTGEGPIGDPSPGGIADDPGKAIRGSIQLGDVVGARRALGPGFWSSTLKALTGNTDIEAEVVPLAYTDPRLLDLPLIGLRSWPDLSEMEHLEAYVRKGGLLVGTGLEAKFRPYIDFLSDLRWGPEVWTEDLQRDHPIYTAFYDLRDHTFRDDLPEPRGTYAYRLKGLYINDRLVGLEFSLPTGVERTEPRDEGHIALRHGQQMSVNIVAYALAREQSAAQRAAQGVQHEQ